MTQLSFLLGNKRQLCLNEYLPEISKNLYN